MAAEGKIDVLVRVRPHAVRSALTDVLEDGSLKISINAPAKDGRGNAVLIKFLSAEFSVPTTSITILSGKTGRVKKVRIASRNSTS